MHAGATSPHIAISTICDCCLSTTPPLCMSIPLWSKTGREDLASSREKWVHHQFSTRFAPTKTVTDRPRGTISHAPYLVRSAKQTIPRVPQRPAARLSSGFRGVHSLPHLWLSSRQGAPGALPAVSHSPLGTVHGNEQPYRSV